MNLSVNRVLHWSPNRISPEAPHHEQVSALQSLSRKRRELARRIDLKSLWEDLDAEGAELPLADIAELAFGQADPDHEAAFLRAVLEHKIYFLPDNNRIMIQTREVVEKELDRLAKRRAKEKEIEDLAAWLRECRNKKMLILPEQGPTPAQARLLTALKRMAANCQEQPDKVWARTILKSIGVTSAEGVFPLLVSIQAMDIDENLDIIRLNFPVEFTRECLQEEQGLPPVTEISINAEDLTDLHVFTIDNANTRDMDDALSLRELPGQIMEIGIHITDVSAFVPAGSFMDQEARERVQTVYMPDATLPMFPEHFTFETASLKPGKTHPTISTLARFNADNELMEFKIVPSMIHVAEKLSYEDVDARIDDPLFSRLFAIGRALRARRVKDGALIIPRPELSILVDENKDIRIQRRLRETPSNVIVSECMILANQLAAETARDAGVPFPYRFQNPPKEKIPVSPDQFDPVVAYIQRRLMNRAQSAVTPKPHYSLALPCYTNVTSPLRRYFDLLAQRQLKSILGLEGPYTKEELETILMEIDSGFARAGAIASQRERYWLLKHLSGKTGKKLGAIVLDRFPRRYQVWLEDYFIDADIPVPFGINLTQGQKIQVVVERVNARKNLLKLRLVE